MTTKIYPDKTFEEAMRKRGFDVSLCWQIEGPPHTGVAWITGYHIRHTIVLHQTYKSGGWEVYTPNNSAEMITTIDDVIARLN